jgi:hypothetical protein
MFVSYAFAPFTPAAFASRTENALTAYGRSFDVPAILEREYDRAEERCRRHGFARQLVKLASERAWLAENRNLF